MSSDIGLIGLAVMGQNLVLNMDRNGAQVSVFNRTSAKTTDFINGQAAGTQVKATYSLEELVASLKRPRRVMLMVQAGKAVDSVIDQLIPLLEPGDVIIDGGNSHFLDTERRSEALRAMGLHFLGVGVSASVEGALWGPSIMPGGHEEAYALMKPIFEAIAAKVNGEPCVSYIGPRGAGHYVQMVHNGIEYGDMQLIAESYDILHRGLGLNNEELKDVFERWNQGVLQSYLIEITADIFDHKDEATGAATIDLILDVAFQKGTGKWTSQSALDLSVATPTIDAAVIARGMSGIKDERMAASTTLASVEPGFRGDWDTMIDAVGDALYAAKVCSYAQGFALLGQASQQYVYNLNLGELARIWRGGCVIRAVFLNDITSSFRVQPDLPNLLMAPFFRDAVASRQSAWRRVLRAAIEMGIPTPAISASLAYFDGYRSARLPANLIQAQRDYFGAHTYERIDRPRGEYYHTDWSGRGGDVTANTYQA